MRVILEKRDVGYLFLFFFVLIAIATSAARFPVPRSDADSWGSILNQFLNVTLDQNGTVRNITFGVNNETIDNIVDGWVRITGALNGTSSLMMGSTNNKANGTPSFAMGNNASAHGLFSFAMGFNTLATGYNSFAMGDTARSSADSSFAMGTSTVATGTQAVAMGNAAIASGSSAFAMGNGPTASGSDAVAMGTSTLASGGSSFAVGSSTNASANEAVAMGSGTRASGSTSFAMGSDTNATNNNAVAMGSSTRASGSQSFAIGSNTIANLSDAVAMGRDTIAGNTQAFAMGELSNATAYASFAMGVNAVASNSQAIAMGNGVIASGSQAVAMGRNSRASNTYATAFGDTTLASGAWSFAVGRNTTASNTGSVAMGENTTSSGNAAFAMGFNTNASGTYSVAMGNGTRATNYASMAFGSGINVTGSYSVGFGINSNIITSLTQSNTFAIVGGTVGINTTGPNPNVALDVNGVIETTLRDGSSTKALCGNHSASGASAQVLDVTLMDCTDVPAADYAEMYAAERNIEAGDIVVPGTKMITTKAGDRLAQLTKSSQPYQSTIIGVISDPTTVTDFNVIGYNIKDGDNPMPVALNGRVKVKASLENGPITIGDYLTSSSTPGVAMKAAQYGTIIGIALEPLDASSPTDSQKIGSVMMFLNMQRALKYNSESNSKENYPKTSPQKSVGSSKLDRGQQSMGKEYGITIYDMRTHEPICIIAENRILKSLPGHCSGAIGQQFKPNQKAFKRE